MRTIPVIAVSLVLAVAVSAGAALAAVKTVGVKKAGEQYHFTASSLAIHKGDTVKWSWKGKTPHNVTGSGFQSKTATKLTFSHRFTKAGRFRVVCTIHAAQGQTMTIRVS